MKIKIQKFEYVFFIISVISSCVLLFGYDSEGKYDYTSPVAVSKGLSIVFLILAAIYYSTNFSNKYSRNIITGLIFGVIGDIYIFAPDGVYFIPGLIFFLIGHIFYIMAFLQLKQKNNLIAIIVLVLFGSSLLGILNYSFINDSNYVMIGPVNIYALVILFMTYLGLTTGIFKAKLAAVLFLLSDSIIAISEFVTPFYMSGIIIWVTYYPAQALFALSLRNQQKIIESGKN